ncbi:MAG TPA: hypothetical protein VFD55_00420 [Candidatus Angelobacter sp.]|nr:hypothetical protein [Candidatus Angelobacter sp.]
MLDSIYHIFTNHLWAPFVSLVEELEAKPAGIYVLIVILIVVATIQSKLILKKRLLQNLPSSTVEASDDKSKHKNKHQPIASNLKFLIITDKIFTLLCLSLVALIIGVCYVRFGSAISDFFKIDTSSKTTPSGTITTPSTTTTTPSTTTTQPTTTTTTTTYEAPKRLYYYCSCSGCWAEGCQQDGYSYGGYDANYYSYYYTLCKACKCNSFNATSSWR